MTTSIPAGDGSVAAAAVAAQSEATATIPSRTSAKRQAIARAATDVFLREGYSAASVDAIVALAGVSKQTLYKQFGSKEQLFLAIVTTTVDTVLRDLTDELAPSLGESVDLEADLLALARRLLVDIMRPDFMALRRLVIGEVNRYPQLGRTWYARGPGRVNDLLVPSLRRLAERGELVIDDPLLTANHFSWLVLSTPQNTMLFSAAESYSAAELERFAVGGVGAFLAAYRPASRAACSRPVQ